MSIFFDGKELKQTGETNGTAFIYKDEDGKLYEVSTTHGVITE